MGFVLLIILNFSMYFSPVSILRKIFILIAQFWVGIIILAKMLFQVGYTALPKREMIRYLWEVFQKFKLKGNIYIYIYSLCHASLEFLDTLRTIPGTW